MRVIQSVIGVFHHFDLAQQLLRRGHLQKVYSTWPWTRLKREGLPRQYVDIFPWLHTPNYLLSRSPVYPASLSASVDRLNNILFDSWIAARHQPCDALIAISGTGLKTGKYLQQEGGIYICDRGSTHHRYQANILNEEYRRWGLPVPTPEPQVTLREEECYQVADVITVPSNVARRSFLAMGVAPEKVHVIPYGMSFNQLPFRAPQAANSFEVLFAGHVSLRKGIPDLLNAFAKVRHQRKHLTIVGAIHEPIKKLLQSLPTQHVTFTGSLPQHRLIEKMSACHLLVLPSIEEGLALVQGQAMAHACPVLATHETGSEDLFTDGVEGFIVPSRNPDALAERMQQIADDPDLQQRLSLAALERVQHLGGWDRYGDLWEALLLQLRPESHPQPDQLS